MKITKTNKKHRNPIHKKECNYRTSSPTHVPGDASSVLSTTYISEHFGDVLTDTLRAAEHSLLQYHLA